MQIFVITSQNFSYIQHYLQNSWFCQILTNFTDSFVSSLDRFTCTLTIIKNKIQFKHCTYQLTSLVWRWCLLPIYRPSSWVPQLEIEPELWDCISSSGLEQCWCTGFVVGWQPWKEIYISCRTTHTTPKHKSQ